LPCRALLCGKRHGAARTGINRVFALDFSGGACIMAFMSLEDYFSGPGAPKFLQSLSDCITSVGSEAFNANYLDLIERIIKADQCMIFSYQVDRPECYLSFNRRHSRNAMNLAEKYLRSGFRNDPLLRVVEEVRKTREVRIVDLFEIRDAMLEQYHRTFYRTGGIVDKISVVAAMDDEVLSLNFYRLEEHGPFQRSEKSIRVPFWRAIASLALMHYTSKLSLDLRSPLNSVSKREKAICEAMLRGLTSDAIAWELDLSVNTVNTYRQRAYSKLGINSKSALFALCNGQNAT
jgi:DNA-binding CsgD family transcriptional regulator